MGMPGTPAAARHKDVVVGSWCGTGDSDNKFAWAAAVIGLCLTQYLVKRKLAISLCPDVGPGSVTAALASQSECVKGRDVHIDQAKSGENDAYEDLRLDVAAMYVLFPR
jgi:hypothetical protein